ncbi:putative HAD superfamily hydrolase [Lindgomyces ingoldianus]|uniref:HAD superfamily hydrolase n=1 Tax=Lindgomyces ingoldianus TaxID=673940 RepID=A0ACB6QR16_9PLEO|nr:putative HAD superfamily hydrolase [Lindgomyces ingoldianus]KAF2469307.1 putative HAD superfamily hydrolase [Lindgomyces ingoldianus]
MAKGKITTILLDCDNTLVLSEDLAFEACAELANEILEKKNVADRFTGPSLLKTFVGQNFRGMMTSLCSKYNFTLTDDEFDSYVSRELGAVVAKLEKDAQPCHGVMDELNKIHANKTYHMAVVSSSALSRVQASIAKVGMDIFFDPKHVYSAATSLPTPTSKPDPAVYIHACKELGVEPGECVAVEDSRSGATAAKRAGIPLIGYVGPYEEEEKVKMRKVLKEECGAVVVMEHWREFPEALRIVEEAAA